MGNRFNTRLQITRYFLFWEFSKVLVAKTFKLESQVDFLTASSGGNSESRDEEWFGCPVCLMLLTPPTRIFQCPEGHILCEECKENPAMVHCPQCR